MWSFPRTILVLSLICALGVATTSTAAAAEWQINEQAMTSSVSVKLKDAGGIKLTDTKGGLFGEEVTIECNLSAEGTAGTGPSGSITSITIAKCATTKGTCPSPTASASNLPWSSSLAYLEESGETRDNVSGSGSEPGISVKCTFITDTCEGKTNVKAEEAPEAPEGVRLNFDANSPKWNCSRGGAGAGVVQGSVLAESPSAGEWLSVKAGLFQFATNHANEFKKKGEVAKDTISAIGAAKDKIDRAADVKGLGRKVAFTILKDGCNGVKIEGAKTCELEYRFEQPAEAPLAAGKKNGLCVHLEKDKSSECAVLVGEW